MHSKDFTQKTTNSITGAPNTFEERLLNYSQLYSNMAKIINSKSNTKTTTIQVSNELKRTLEKRKFVDAESYEEVIWSLLEDTMELNEETKRDIAQSEKEINQGKFITIENLKKRINLN
jgi:predicted transcriptional regulator